MSCLFDSLSSFTPHSSQELRQRIVSYLGTNPKLMNDASFEEIIGWESTDKHQYLNAMTQQSTWGGAIEIKAFVNMSQANVFVHIPAIHKIVEFVVDEHRKHEFPCLHILWTGNHFVPIRHVESPVNHVTTTPSPSHS